MNTTTPNKNRPIGDIISQTNNLTPDQVEAVLQHQKTNGSRFGEAAVALGFINGDDVVWALAQQYEYPYSHAKTSSLSEELIVARHPFSPEAEMFRELRSQLLISHFPENQPHRPFAVLSPNRGDGKSFFAANLAIAFAQLGRNTVLIDADLRNPRLSSMFGLTKLDGGLADTLAGRAAPNVYIPAQDLPNLYLLPAGNPPPNPLELIERTGFSQLLAELSKKFDYVIVDTPASEVGADNGAIAARCGAGMVIARKDQSREADMARLLTVLKIAKVDVAGVLLNEC